MKPKPPMPKTVRKSIQGMKNNEINTQRWGKVQNARFGRGGAPTADGAQSTGDGY